VQLAGYLCFTQEFPICFAHSLKLLFFAHFKSAAGVVRADHADSIHNPLLVLIVLRILPAENIGPTAGCCATVIATVLAIKNVGSATIRHSSIQRTHKNNKY
jgi:hypothetical protein